MDINLYYLSYCGHCSSLIEWLDDNKVSYTAIDADDDVEQSSKLEELLDTNNYPILEVYLDTEVIYYINESIEPTRLRDNIFIQPWSSIDSLTYQITELIKYK